MCEEMIASPFVKPRAVELAIDYTLNQQGENLIDFEEWLEMKGESLGESEMS